MNRQTTARSTLHRLPAYQIYHPGYIVTRSRPQPHLTEHYFRMTSRWTFWGVYSLSYVNFRYKCLDVIRDLDMQVPKNYTWYLYCSKPPAEAFMVADYVLFAVQYRCMKHDRTVPVMYRHPSSLNTVLKFRRCTCGVMSYRKCIHTVFRKIFLCVRTLHYITPSKIFDEKFWKYSHVQCNHAFYQRIIKDFWIR